MDDSVNKCTVFYCYFLQKILFFLFMNGVKCLLPLGFEFHLDRSYIARTFAGYFQREFHTPHKYLCIYVMVHQGLNNTVIWQNKESMTACSFL